MDTEKVISELQEYHDREWTDEREYGFPARKERRRITGNALALLYEKDQECIHLLRECENYMAERDKLLQEKAPLAPIRASDHDSPDGMVWYVCPSCRIAIDYQDKYCRHCGRELVW